MRNSKLLSLFILLGLMPVAHFVQADHTPSSCQEQPEFDTPEWHVCENQNAADANGRLHDQETNPAFHAQYAAVFGETFVAGTSNRSGDPFRQDWVAQGRGQSIDISFKNRNGARLTGILWMPNAAAPGSLPGVVITNGCCGSSHNAYWWIAQGLAEDGYMVLLFNYQGAGDSDVNDGDGECNSNGCPSAQNANYVEGTLDAFDFLVSTPADPAADGVSFNPWSQWLDRDHLGAAGHSGGAWAMLPVQDLINRGASDPESARFLDRGMTLPIVDTVIGWDTLGSDNVEDPAINAAIPLRVPAMSQNGDYFVATYSSLLRNCGQFSCDPATQPDPDGLRIAHLRWRDAGIETMQVAFFASTHQEWSYAAGLAASHWGERLAMYYTLAWFDRHLKNDPTALPRLIADTFDGSADASAIGAGYYDVVTLSNQPWLIAGLDVRNNLSIYTKTSYWLEDGEYFCDDVKAGPCPHTLGVYAGNEYYDETDEINALLTYNAPLAPVVRLGPDATSLSLTVNYSPYANAGSFRAQLNGASITSLFNPAAGASETVSIPVQAGSNEVKLRALLGNPMGNLQGARMTKDIDTITVFVGP